MFENNGESSDEKSATENMLPSLRFDHLLAPGDSKNYSPYFGTDSSQKSLSLLADSDLISSLMQDPARSSLGLMPEDFSSTPSSLYANRLLSESDMQAAELKVVSSITDDAASHFLPPHSARSHDQLDQATKSLQQLYVGPDAALLSQYHAPFSASSSAESLLLSASPSVAGGAASSANPSVVAQHAPGLDPNASVFNASSSAPCAPCAAPTAVVVAVSAPAAAHSGAVPVSAAHGAQGAGAAMSVYPHAPYSSSSFLHAAPLYAPPFSLPAQPAPLQAQQVQPQGAPAPAQQPFFLQAPLFVSPGPNGQPMFFRPPAQFPQEFLFPPQFDAAVLDPNAAASLQFQAAQSQGLFFPGVGVLPNMGMLPGYWAAAAAAAAAASAAAAQGAPNGPPNGSADGTGGTGGADGAAHAQQHAAAAQRGMELLFAAAAMGFPHMPPPPLAPHSAPHGAPRGAPAAPYGVYGAPPGAMLPVPHTHSQGHTQDKPPAQPAPHNAPSHSHSLSLSQGGRAEHFLGGEGRRGAAHGHTHSHPHRAHHAPAPAHGAARHPLVDEFRGTFGKSQRQWSLTDLSGHVVSFCQDQYGSRFIQQRLEVCSEEERAMVFEEALRAAPALMTDVFGNYVLQKLFEYGAPAQCEALAALLRGQAVALALQMYGCRVVQKALEYVSNHTLVELVAEFQNPQTLIRCVHDSNGNHVIQKCIEVVSRAAQGAQDAQTAVFLRSRIQFIVDAFAGQVRALAAHPYGCRVVQRILEHCSDAQKASILEELRECCAELVQDCYGNYVIQFVMQHGWAADRAVLIREVQSRLLEFSQHKFASNVVEKCLQFAHKKDRDEMIWTIIHATFDLNSPVDAKGHCVLESMVRDPYANYVVQKVIDVSDERQRAAIVRYVKENIQQLRKYTYGKHIIVRLEKITGEKF